MSNGIDLLKQLVVDLELFESLDDDMQRNYADFVEYLYQKQNNKRGVSQIDFHKQKSYSPHQTTEISIASYITTLFRYAKNYTKTALDNTIFSTIDDFGFAASLLRTTSMTKTELIHEHLMEITSGTEVIKRLKKNGVIQEFQDPDDKRSKRVQLSEKGREEIIRSFEKMNLAAHVISGNLTDSEQTKLLEVLEKLKKFHENVYEQDRKSNLDVIANKYL